MAIELPDVNVLLALVDPAHPHHNDASLWYASLSSDGWATCPLTQNGLVRVISSPVYPGIRLRVADAINLLHQVITNPAAQHHFWPDDVSLSDTSLFDGSAIAGPKQITDIYLLGLCKRKGGTLATLDARITTAAIVAPRADLLRTL